MDTGVYNQAYIDLFNDFSRLVEFVRAGVRAVAKGRRLPMTPAQLDGASRILIPFDMHEIEDEIKDVYLESWDASRTIRPEIIAERVARALPMLTIARPTWKRDMIRSLRGLVMHNTARRIQTTFRRIRNDPYMYLGRRIALRRAGFDPNQPGVNTAALRGVRAALR
jgi:hypothetical protein